jgi:hypothetical protein
MISAAFSPSMHEDVFRVMEYVGVSDIEPSEPVSRVRVGDCHVDIPYRIYFREAYPSDFKGLTKTQEGVLAAIMSRHYSGYQREIWARQLCLHPANWTAPFVVFLLGDYVREVLLIMHEQLNSDWKLVVHDFLDKNAELKKPLNYRIISYWDSYYRCITPSLTDYPGYAVAERLGIWDKKVAPRLTRASRCNQSSVHL